MMEFHSPTVQHGTRIFLRGRAEKPQTLTGKPVALSIIPMRSQTSELVLGARTRTFLTLACVVPSRVVAERRESTDGERSGGEGARAVNSNTSAVDNEEPPLPPGELALPSCCKMVADAVLWLTTTTTLCWDLACVVEVMMVGVFS